MNHFPNFGVKITKFDNYHPPLPKKNILMYLFLLFHSSLQNLIGKTPSEDHPQQSPQGILQGDKNQVVIGDR